MKKHKFQFKLGIRNENWEFDLEPIPGKYKGRDSYKYIGKEKFYYYGLEVKEIELTFELDILVEVKLILKSL